jgi:futalosine hydrolase
MEQINLAILGATSREIAAFSRDFPLSCEFDIAGNPFGIHTFGDLRLLIGTTGIGKVNAAAVCAAVLAKHQPANVWNIGCSGAYRESGLGIGDVLISRNCICADEGILRKDGTDGMGVIGIPLLMKGGSPIYDRFPLDEILQRGQIPSLIPPGTYLLDSSGLIRHEYPEDVADRCFRLAYGESLTVGMASGDPETANERFRLHRALAENMEGSAVAQVCFLFDVPFLEIRGISNIAGVRDKSMWDFDAAFNHSVGVAAHLVQRFRLVL